MFNKLFRQNLHKKAILEDNGFLEKHPLIASGALSLGTRFPIELYAGFKANEDLYKRFRNRNPDVKMYPEERLNVLLDDLRAGKYGNIKLYEPDKLTIRNALENIFNRKKIYVTPSMVSPELIAYSIHKKMRSPATIALRGGLRIIPGASTAAATLALINNSTDKETAYNIYNALSLAGAGAGIGGLLMDRYTMNKALKDLYISKSHPTLKSYTPNVKSMSKVLIPAIANAALMTTLPQIMKYWYGSSVD